MGRTGQTTIRADVVLPMSAARATDGLARVFCPDADTTERAVRLSVGPSRGAHGLAKQVMATLTPARRHGSTYVFELRWTPVGVTARAYPTLDAKLGVTAVDDITSLLSIVATYVPPLGAFGATVDRAALSRVAEATVVALLHELATAITHAPQRMAGV